MEKFNPEDPISAETIKHINEYLFQSLRSLIDELKNHQVNCLVGSAGAFETVVDMIGNDNTSSGRSYYAISMPDYTKISKNTIHSSAADREKMPGLIPMRRDMIVLSYLLIDFVIHHAGIQNIKVSTYSLKEGALFEIINANNC